MTEVKETADNDPALALTWLANVHMPIIVSDGQRTRHSPTATLTGIRKKSTESQGLGFLFLKQNSLACLPFPSQQGQRAVQKIVSPSCSVQVYPLER